MNSEFDRNVAARRTTKNGERQKRINTANPALEERAKLGFSICNTAECAAHHRADAIAIFLRQIDSRIIQRHRCAHDGKMSESIQPLCFFLIQVIRRDEIIHLGSVVTAKWGRIEPRETAYRRALSADSIPQSFACQTDRSDRPDSGYYYSALRQLIIRRRISGYSRAGSTLMTRALP